MSFRVLSVALVLVILTPLVIKAGPPATAKIHFGQDVGSPFPPQDGHDGSFHAADKMVPRTVTIAQGGSVIFDISAFHQVAIYAAGTQPGDITVDPSTLEDWNVPCPPFTIPDFRINDPSNRVALGPSAICDDAEWTTPGGTFDQPGRYLITCTTAPHFVEADMFGWVIVR